MWRIPAPIRALAVAALVLLAACSSRSEADARPGDRLIWHPEPSTGPYVVVAVDNHFHDIHPVDRVHINENRPFVVVNEGHNLHNFTVLGTGISVDLPPGHQLVWSRLGAHLAPGPYHIICTYHSYVYGKYRRMRGFFVVTG